MNKVILVGRLTKDATITSTTGERATTVARFGLAVARRGQDAGADFPSCVAFGKTAEFIEKYCKKGTKLVIEGHIQTGSYEKGGKKVYTTDVVLDSCEFAESKANGEATQNAPQTDADGFMNIPDNADDEGLPF